MTDWEARVAALEQEVRVLRDEKAALEASAASASELISAMNDEIDALRAQQEQPQEPPSQQQSPAAELCALRRELDEARATIARLQAAAPAPASDARTVATLQSQIVVLRRRVAEARAAQQDTEALAAGLAAELRAREAQCARIPDLERALAAAQTARLGRVDALAGAELRARLAEEQARTAALAADVADLRRALADAAAPAPSDADAAQQQVARLCVARADAECACRRAQRELAAARSELAAWRADTLAQYVAQHARAAPDTPAETQARARTGARLAALFRGASGAETEALPAGFVAQVQDVLGATLRKNAQLQHDILAIAEECDTLTAQLRQLQGEHSPQ